MWKFFIIFPFSPTVVQGVSRDSKQTIGRPQKPLRLLNRSTCSREDVQRTGCWRSSSVARPSTLQVSRIGPGTLRNSDPTNFLSLSKCLFTHAHQSRNGSLTTDQLKKIRPKRLRNIICNNIGISSVRETVLLVASPRWFMKGKTSKKCVTCQYFVDNAQ